VGAASGLKPRQLSSEFPPDGAPSLAAVARLTPKRPPDGRTVLPSSLSQGGETADRLMPQQPTEGVTEIPLSLLGSDATGNDRAKSSQDNVIQSTNIDDMLDRALVTQTCEPNKVDNTCTTYNAANPSNQRSPVSTTTSAPMPTSPVTTPSINWADMCENNADTHFPMFYGHTSHDSQNGTSNALPSSLPDKAYIRLD